MSGFRVSVANYLATATLTVSSEDSAYPRSNFAIPTKPGMPLKFTVATDSWIVADLGSAKGVDVGALIHSNFASFRLQGHTSNSWGAPDFDSGLLTIGRGPNGRYQHAHQPATTKTFRWWRWFIPTQTPTDGASVFSVGGGWLGALITAPRHVLVEGTRIRINRPRLIESPAHNGWEQESRVGLAWMSLVARRLAHPDSGLLYTEWLAWLDLERQWADSPAALVCYESTLPSWSWVMKMAADPEWGVSLYSDAELDCREMT